MSEFTVDPRHSPAFQRGHGDAVEHVRFDRRAHAEGAPAAPSRWSLSEEGAFEETPKAYVQESGPAGRSVDESGTGSGSGTESGSGSAEAADVVAEHELAAAHAARRRFRTWTIVFFVIGAALLAISFITYRDASSLQNFVYSTDGGGVFSIDGTDGSRIVGDWDLYFADYRSMVAPWLASVGLATILGNLFRMAARR